MNAPPAIAGHPASRAPSPKTEPPERDRDDILVAAYRLRGLGWTEPAALMFIEDMQRQSRDRAGRRIRRMSEVQITRRLKEYSAEMAARGQRRPRGDLVQIRSMPRWPWRTST